MLAPEGAALNGRAARVRERAECWPGESWPPEGAEAVQVDDLYDRLTERGFEYGPAFQGLQAAWRRGDELFAEVALSEEQRDQASCFGVHPALLDAAFHAGLSSLAGQTPGAGSNKRRGAPAVLLQRRGALCLGCLLAASSALPGSERRDFPARRR